MKCAKCSSEFTPHDRATIGSNAGDYVEVRTACPSCEHVYYTFTSGPWTEEDQGNTPQSPTPTGLPPKAQGCAPRATLGNNPQPPTNPERVASIPDPVLQEIERLVNATLRELVMGEHHAEDNQIEEAQNCFTTCGMNTDRIQDLLEGALP